MKRRLALLIASVALCMPLLGATALAASATLSLSPSAYSVANGSYVTVYIYENSGSTAVNGVQANFTYNSSLLAFVSIGSSSTFSVDAQDYGSGGTVKVARGAFSAVTGSHLVASVTFRALASSGTASFSFASGSAVSTTSGGNILSGTSGTSVSLTSPPKAAPKDTTPPKISGVKVIAVTTSSATVTWKTSEAAASEVDYGLNTRYGLSAVDKHYVTSHKIVLSSPVITPATLYHFIVKSSDKSGNAAKGHDATFTSTGLQLAVLVTDSQTNKPVQGASVSFAKQTVTTDKDGRATLTGLPTGTITIAITNAGTTTAEVVDIGLANGGKIQTAAFKVATPGPGNLPAAIIAVMAVFLVAFVAAGGFAIGQRFPIWQPAMNAFKNKFPRGSQATQQPAAVVQPLATAKPATQLPARPQSRPPQTPGT